VAVLVLAEGDVAEHVGELLRDFATVILTQDPASAAAALLALASSGPDGWPAEHPPVALPAGAHPAGAHPAGRGPAAVLGDLRVDPDRHEATWRGRPLPLTAHELALLHSLMQPPRRVWSYAELHERVWGGIYLGNPGIVHSAVKRLRRRMAAADIAYRVRTVRCAGFRLEV
jgi:DNA-binding response OmpR family regulator